MDRLRVSKRTAPRFPTSIASRYISDTRRGPPARSRPHTRLLAEIAIAVDVTRMDCNYTTCESRPIQLAAAR
ncbi:predicted protein [Plenodomus lingam JN3]|uniref:Predicted protein n=1 Tax=Leptosphaeria maculans (strain JN3 / isolate v23.1.3 / race Av1-4-5-6-7-8) TaxID=985895 RepID=E5ABN9_LEPMJ|nr:predicted protein [Plenodomus lingam JN3]CBY01080.1 predicted protein [Plenodomus lingam JN3]